MERVEPDVEVDGVDEAGRGGQLDKAGGLRRGHRQRLLADDVPPGCEDLAGLRDVEVVRRGDVDDVDGRVREHLVQRLVGVRDAERLGPGRATLRRAAEDAAHLDADPAQLLDVDGPDEPRADDGRADLGNPPRAQLTHLQLSEMSRQSSRSISEVSVLHAPSGSRRRVGTLAR